MCIHRRLGEVIVAVCPQIAPPMARNTQNAMRYVEYVFEVYPYCFEPLKPRTLVDGVALTPVRETVHIHERRNPGTSSLDATGCLKCCICVSGNK